MSYDIYIVDPTTKEPLRFSEPMKGLEGGTYALGGTTEAHLNITYNYSKFYYEHLDNEKGIRWLYGKKVKDTMEALLLAFKSMEGEPDDDYWAPTEGNAKYALMQLILLAAYFLDGEWDGD